MATRRLYTLIFLKKNNEILFGYKRRGYGANNWNGFGGKLDDDETLYQCAKRELKEESNLDADLKHVGVLYRNLYDDYLDIVHIYTGTNFVGDIKETDEMCPIKWFSRDDIPYIEMLPDCRCWFEMIIDEKYFSTQLLTEDQCDVKEFESYHEFLKYLKTKRLLP